MKIFENYENRGFFLNYMEKIVLPGAGAGILDKLDPEPELELEPDKNGPAPQHWVSQQHPIRE
jgi:hypothetical protein